MTEVSRRSVPYARLPDGSDLACPVIEAMGDRDGPTALLVGGIHGDEYEGPLALLDLAGRLAALPLAGRVLIVPFANGPALGAGTRTSPLDGINLARIFPGDPAGSPSQRLAASLFALLDGTDLLVDSHSGGVELAFLPVAGFYAEGPGIEAPTAAASRALAEATGLPDLWELPHQPGVLSYEAARRGLAVTGCEVGGRGHAAPRDVALYRDAYLRVLAARGMVDPVAAPTRRGRLLRGNWTLSEASGLFRPLKPLGASVQAGEAVARVEAPLGGPVAELAAASEGIIMAERNLCRIREGDLALCVATAEALA